MDTDNWRVTTIFSNRCLLDITYAVYGFLTTYMALIVIPIKLLGLVREYAEYRFDSRGRQITGATFPGKTKALQPDW